MNENMMSDIVAVLHVLAYPGMALILSLGLTWLCVRVLPILGFIDKGGGRHIHKGAIPRGGGIAVALAFFLSLGLAIPAAEPFGTQAVFLRLFLPSLPIIILGVLDDRFNLNAKLKLAVQLLVAVLIWYMNRRDFTFFSIACSSYVSLPFIVVWVILVVNAFNLIDGMDGLASGLAFISSGCMALWFLLAGRNQPEALAMLILAAACLGFLRFNFHPAKIFLGDTGSTFIGVIFAVTGISAVDRAVTFASLAMPMLAVGVPLFDVGLAIWRRSIRMRTEPEVCSSVMDADKDHLHHRLLREGEHDQTRTAFRMYFICAVFSAMALLLLLLRGDSMSGIAYIVMLTIMVMVVRKYATIELSDSAMLIQNGIARPRHGILFGTFHPILDAVLIFLSFILTSYLMFSTTRLGAFFYVLAPMMAIFWLCGIYKIYWLRCGIRAFFRMLLTVIAAGATGQVVLYILIREHLYFDLPLSDRQFLIGALLFILLTMLVIMLERLMLYYATMFLFQELHLETQAAEEKEPISVLLYGGGLHCRMYVQALYALSRESQGRRMKIVGIVDDDRVLKGLQVCDFPVLGGVADLDAILSKYKIDRVVVTTRIKPRFFANLRSICTSHQVELHRFEVRDIPLAEPADAETY